MYATFSLHQDLGDTSVIYSLYLNHIAYLGIVQLDATATEIAKIGTATVPIWRSQRQVDTWGTGFEECTAIMRVWNKMIEAGASPEHMLKIVGEDVEISAVPSEEPLALSFAGAT